MDVNDFLKKCPPIGANKKFLVTCNGKPFAGFDSHSGAKVAVEMYKQPVKMSRGKVGLNFNVQCDWSITDNPDYKGK